MGIGGIHMKWLLKHKIKILLPILIIGAILGSQISFTTEVVNKNSIQLVGNEEIVFTIGNKAYAASTPDYTCDGAADNIQFQAAIDALPSVGGKIVVLSGTYSFSSGVTRAISNVTIEGTGAGSYITLDGVNPVFTAGGNGWAFNALRTDAGGIAMGATTNWSWTSIVINTTYYAFRSPYGNSTFASTITDDITAGGDILPSANATYDLGSTSYEWDNGYFDDLYIDGNPVSSGDVATDTIWDAKGDLAVGTGSNTASKLTAGTDGYYLKANSSTGTGLEWAALAGGGDVSVSGTPSDGQVSIWTDSSTIEGSTAGAVFVASSTSTLAEKAWALMTGGSICDLTDDWADIEAAATLSSNGRVTLGSGIFDLDSGSVEVIDSWQLYGQGSDYHSTNRAGTVITYATSNDGIRIKEGGRISHLTIDTPTSFAGNALLIQGDTDEGIYEQQLIVYDVQLLGDRTNNTGNGLVFKADSASAGDDHYQTVQASSAAFVTIDGYNRGVYFLCDEDTTAPEGQFASLNGITLINFWISDCTYYVEFEGLGDGSPSISENILHNFNLNAIDGSPRNEDCIKMSTTSEITYNRFTNLMFWDMTDIDGEGFNLDENSYYNLFDGMFAGILPPVNSGSYNTWNDNANPSYDIKQRPANLLSSGRRTWGRTAAATSVGDVVELHTDNKWYKTNATNSTYSDGDLAICLVATTGVADTLLLLEGNFRNDSWTWNEGVDLYLSASVAGGLTETPPTGSGNIIRIVARAHDYDDTIYFHPSPDRYTYGSTGITHVNGVAIQ